jgi:hypothetical protein
MKTNSLRAIVALTGARFRARVLPKTQAVPTDRLPKLEAAPTVEAGREVSTKETRESSLSKARYFWVLSRR